MDEPDKQGPYVSEREEVRRLIGKHKPKMKTYLPEYANGSRAERAGGGGGGLRQRWACVREARPDLRREFPTGNSFQFPMHFGIWQDFVKLHKEILDDF
jgi:hypothetical protein